MSDIANPKIQTIQRKLPFEGYLGVMGGSLCWVYGTHGCRFIHPSIIAHFVCLDFLILVLDLFCNNRWGLRES